MSELCLWDLDGTIRPGSLSSDALVHGIEAGFIDPTPFKDPTDLQYDEVDDFMKALSQQSRAVFTELLDRISDEAKAEAFPWALERLKEQHDTYHPVILSHSPDFLVRAFARGLGLVRHARGSYFHTKDLVFSGRAQTLHKARAASRYSREKGITTVRFGAGDGEADIPILQRAEHAVAVNPTGRLLEVATTNNWEIVVTNHE